MYDKSNSLNEWAAKEKKEKCCKWQFFTHLNGLDLPEIFKRLSHSVLGSVFGQMPDPQCCTADWRDGQKHELQITKLMRMSSFGTEKRS